MAIFIIRENESFLHQPKDIGIVSDVVEVLNELPSVSAAVAMLFGLMYVLNMEYPKGFTFTFEALQKILLELGSNKMSSKIRQLNGELHRAQYMFPKHRLGVVTDALFGLRLSTYFSFAMLSGLSSKIRRLNGELNRAQAAS